MNIEIEHGKADTYTNWGCRCDECRKAATERNREYRKTRLAKIKPEEHGKYNTYAYGCRCDECRRANRLHQKAYMLKRQRKLTEADARKMFGGKF